MSSRPETPPVASVVMPAYNAGQYIGQAIDSILNQDIGPLELIVVDDGSTDGTRDLLQQRAREHDMIRVIEGAHRGASRALNCGIEAANAEWIAIMHADDVALPARLRRQLAAARQEPDVVVWGTHAYHIAQDGRMLGMSRFGPTSVDDFCAKWKRGADILVLHPTAMMRREVLQRVGGYSPEFANAEDFELFTRMAHFGPIVALPEPLLLYRLHMGTNTMKRFFMQRANARYVSARRAAELAGKQPETIVEYRRRRTAVRFLATRLVERWLDAGYYCYRRTAVLYGYRRYVRAAGFMVAAVLLNPAHAARRLWLQRLSPTARKLQKQF